MKLHYWRPPSRAGSPVTNFGDELNTVLWPRLLGTSFFDDDDEVAFLGIGSLLGWPKQGDGTRRHRVVFGTGAAFEDAADREPCDASWRIYCVRGPLTARAYGLDASLAVVDPAILLATLHQRVEPTVQFGYMPHLIEAARWSHVAAPVCDAMGIRYIDPRDEVDAIIGAIASTSVMITEAMHGAIAADALRVPWVPVYTTRRPHRFKWTDWCQSMQLDFGPRRLLNAADWSQRVGVRGARVERSAASVFAAQLRRVMLRVRPTLSSPAIHGEKVERLETALAAVRSDVRSGRFADA